MICINKKNIFNVSIWPKTATVSISGPIYETFMQSKPVFELHSPAAAAERRLKGVSCTTTFALSWAWKAWVDFSLTYGPVHHYASQRQTDKPPKCNCPSLDVHDSMGQNRGGGNSRVHQEWEKSEGKSSQIKNKVWKVKISGASLPRQDDPILVQLFITAISRQESYH